eukprot:CAMPEP_0180729970 /NCGR_PEP_ID=MMETSP1038_2-20121128/20378_1 /TAXON_ID=632150 /ORGANISM="Azadinium spinosum, Strain 3D9" /LENGTH=378 /DNA_ID=CAMNT_0022762715 /DNA_START=82 /DNA_END=1218 /DNA_ORIENTATION=-
MEAPFRRSGSSAVVLGHVVTGAAGSYRERTTEERTEDYESAGVPFGLAEVLAKEDKDVALRVFLLDNSGSTSHSDGHLLVQTGDSGFYKILPATRWEEIRAMALDQARWNVKIGVRAEFLLLNPPCPQEPVEGRDYIIIDPAKGSGDAQVSALADLLEKNGPRGPTPLVSRMRQLRQRLQQDLPTGEKVMLSIVTDGLPTSPTNGKSMPGDQRDFVEELRQFAAAFNSFIIIRLCTDDGEAVGYYNKVDEEVELSLDILDDLQGEAQEVYDGGNPWLAYSPLMHRIREGGTMNKLFDLLDERPLGLVEMATFLEYLLKGRGDPPFPRDPESLLLVAENALARAPLVFDGRTAKMAKPVDLRLLKKALQKKGSIACSLM